jgi:hypothetical protein
MNMLLLLFVVCTALNGARSDGNKMLADTKSQVTSWLLKKLSQYEELRARSWMVHGGRLLDEGSSAYIDGVFAYAQAQIDAQRLDHQPRREDYETFNTYLCSDEARDWTQRVSQLSLNQQEALFKKISHISGDLNSIAVRKLLAVLVEAGVSIDTAFEDGNNFLVRVTSADDLPGMHFAILHKTASQRGLHCHILEIVHSKEAAELLIKLPQFARVNKRDQWQALAMACANDSEDPGVLEGF